MAVHKKGDATFANNYHPVLVMGPLPTLYMAHLKNQITIETEHSYWRAPIKIGFCKKPYMQDLIIAVDYLIDRSKVEK